MVSWPKKIIIAIFLVFVIFLTLSKPVGEKIEEKKRNDLEKICHQIDEKIENFYYLREIYDGYETFKLDGIASFSASIDETLEFTEDMGKKSIIKKSSGELEDLRNQCEAKLLALEENLKKIKPTFDYLETIYPIYKNLGNSLKEAEAKKYQGFVNQAGEIKEHQKGIEQGLGVLIKLIPPQEFEKSQLYLKKALSGMVDFWSNAEVAIVRRTPYIFNYSLWVSQNDWEQIEKVMTKEFSFSL